MLGIVTLHEIPKHIAQWKTICSRVTMILKTTTIRTTPTTAAMIFFCAPSTASLLPPEVTQARAPRSRKNKAARPATTKNNRITKVRMPPKLGIDHPRFTDKSAFEFARAAAGSNKTESIAPVLIMLLRCFEIKADIFSIISDDTIDK